MREIRVTVILLRNGIDETSSNTSRRYFWENHGSFSFFYLSKQLGQVGSFCHGKTISLNERKPLN